MPLQIRRASWIGGTLDKIKQIDAEIGFPELVQPETPDEYYFLRTKFVTGEEIGAHTTPNKMDMGRNLEKWVGKPVGQNLEIFLIRLRRLLAAFACFFFFWTLGLS